MARLWGSLGQCLLLSLLLMPAGQAVADSITVDTTDDVIADDKHCSLREALGYFANRPISLESGESFSYFGCAKASTETSSSDSISLSKGVFQLSSPLVIPGTLTITGKSFKEGDADETRIVAAPNKRIFLIDDTATTATSVTLSKLALVGGSALASSVKASAAQPDGYCETAGRGQGGAICSREVVNLDTVQFRKNSAADEGGAVFVATGGSLVGSSVVFVANSAPAGAAIYSSQNAIALKKSSLYGQCDTAAPYAAPAACLSSYVIHINSSTTSGSQSLENLTISGNKARAIFADAVVTINNSTILGNAAGVEFSGRASFLNNSVLAGNTGASCSGAGSVTLNYSLIDSCAAATQNNVQLLGAQTLVASASATAADPGLFSVLKDNGGDLLTHKPRLPMSLVTLNDSPVVDKGNPASTGATCASSDERGKEREGGSCDIGAVEFQFSIDVKNEFKIISGQSVTSTFVPDLGDADVVPSASCTATYSAFPAPYTALSTMEPFVSMANASRGYAGCMLAISLGDSVTKGSVTFNSTDSTFTYTPYTAYHGVGRFRYLLTTTSSRLNVDPNQRYVKVDSSIVSEPASGLSTSTVNVGGAWSFELFGVVLLLAGIRRGRK